MYRRSARSYAPDASFNTVVQGGTVDVRAKSHCPRVAELRARRHRLRAGAGPGHLVVTGCFRGPGVGRPDRDRQRGHLLGRRRRWGRCGSRSREGSDPGVGQVGERARRDQRTPGEADHQGQQERPGPSGLFGQGARRAGPRGRVREQPGRVAELGLRRLPEGEGDPGARRQRVHPRPMGLESHVLPPRSHRDPQHHRHHRHHEAARLQEHRIAGVRGGGAVRGRQRADQEPLGEGRPRLRVWRSGELDGARLHRQLSGRQGRGRQAARAADRNRRPGQQDRRRLRSARTTSPAGSSRERRSAPATSPRRSTTPTTRSVCSPGSPRMRR